jgi:hypothetical protein
LGVARQFENLHALVHVELLRRFVSVDLALQVLLLPPSPPANLSKKSPPILGSPRH